MLPVLWLLLTVSSFLTFVMCVIHIRKKYSFWRELGVPYIPASFPLGNIQHTSHLMVELYQELKGKHPFGGLFQFTEPVALITDPEMVKNVLVRDCRFFYDRGGYTDGKHDPLTGHMLNSESERWCALRHAASPIFSTGRIRAFLPVMLEKLNHFREYLNGKVNTEGTKVELKEMIGKLNTDIAMSFVLGIEGNNLIAPDGGLHEALLREAFLLPNVVKLFLMTCYRSIAKKMRLKMFSNYITELFQQVVRETIEHRKDISCLNRRTDLIDQLLAMPGFDGKSTLTLSQMAAQVFLFLGAYDATGIATFFCLYELAQRPAVQERARACVLEALEKHGGITYDALADMSYIDQCLNETLRMHPLAINLVRVVTKNYPVPDASGVVLPKGLNIVVPVYAIHYDTQYYPEPERFDPDRFLPEACRQRTPYTFLPFGVGPKSCIGYRQGKIQLRAMMAVLLSSYEFTKCPNITQGSRSKAHTVLKLDGDLWLNVKPINRTNDG
ncbi:probable cytochrome P450 6a14 [Anopheles funestus]|uniref:probable cytochrome P450 6a14 n=1 Tax=Anopheles funestus TaxID=62324 RepID=UPI0020C5FDFC|nr:probable cytochrome P450 6a14 [Anopheles funestus]